MVKIHRKTARPNVRGHKLMANRERARQYYIANNHKLPNDFIDSILLRESLLTRNSFFTEEWNRLCDLLENEGGDLYHQERKKFEEKWYVLFPEGVHDLDMLPSLFVKLGDFSDISSGRVSLVIDLNGSKKKILSEVTNVISSWHEEFNKRLKWYPYQGFPEKQKFESNASSARLPGNTKSKENFSDYDLDLDIWDAKESELSYETIAKKFTLNSKETARNSYRRARKLIQRGLPGLPPFP